ncbi:MAG: carboxypeptidase regulatory-like domain-containing protein [Elusimicrobia bacterium]|nr:carboxypeptidase regulatory-like domain-containing protein [Elusimicrobiota bacterium]
MTESLPCPGCSTPLPPEATGCQVCMRARTKQEIVRGYTQLRESKERRRRLPLKIAAFLLIAGAVGKFGWDFRAVIRTTAGTAMTRVAAWYDQFTDPKNYAPRGAETPAENAGAETPKSISPLAAQTTPPPGLLDDGPAGRAAAPPSSSHSAAAAPPAVKPPVAKNAWRVSGVVYDLSSLEPVPDAELTFFGDGRQSVTTKTGADGTYEADLVKGDGWTVSMVSLSGQKAQLAGKGGGWRKGQIIDVDPPYRQRDADERRAAIESLSDGDLAPAPVQWKRSASKVHLDLVAVPALHTPHDIMGR